MRCRTILSKQIYYELGELTPTERVQVDAHLASCARCRARYEEGERLRELLAPVAAEQPLRDLWPELASRLTNREAPNSVRVTALRARRVWRPAAALVGLAAAAALMLSFMHGPADLPIDLDGGNESVAAATVDVNLVREDPWAGDVARALDVTLPEGA
ncbi:MAG TPA: zf-HC2 domain-containing protein [Armatimonadota bacterium]|jgi:anti-sigma factor RsiW